MEPNSRTCTKCSVVKPFSEFSKAPRGLYGIKASCKACDAARHVRIVAARPPRKRDEEAARVRYTKRQSGLKTCSACGIAKERTEFSKSKDGKYGPILHSTCKPCNSERAKKWFADNPERTTANGRRFNLEKNYGLTVEQYEAILVAQGSVCALCKKDEPAVHGRTGKKFRLSVDHCHATGRIRGLLCQKCNRAIGLMGDSVDLLKRAIDYLERE